MFELLSQHLGFKLLPFVFSDFFCLLTDLLKSIKVINYLQIIFRPILWYMPT